LSRIFVIPLLINTKLEIRIPKEARNFKKSSSLKSLKINLLRYLQVRINAMMSIINQKDNPVAR